MEVIVSDGGSTDESIAIASSTADSLIENTAKIKQTISMGRNAGANHSTGEILIFLNGDTVVEDAQSFLGKVGDVMNDHKTVAATCRVAIYPEEEGFSDKLFHGFFNYYFWFLNVIGLGMGRGECQIVRRKDFFAVRGYNESLAAGEDFDLFVRLRRHGKIAFINSLVVWESPRRFRRFGYMTILWQWFKNAISVLVTGKSISDDWEPIR